MTCINDFPLTYLSFFSDNDITDILDLTFSVDDDRFGEMVTVDLKPEGSEIEVTEENKVEYVE
jgi:E3 ubiquitin-protein ligase NEDD4